MIWIYETTITLINDEADVVREEETVPYAFDLAAVRCIRAKEGRDERCVVFFEGGDSACVNAPYARVLAAWREHRPELFRRLDN